MTPDTAPKAPAAPGDYTHPELEAWWQDALATFPAWGLFKASSTRLQSSQDRLYTWGRELNGVGVKNPQAGQGPGWYPEQAWMEGQALGELRADGMRWLPYGKAVATKDVGSHGRREDGYSNAIDVAVRGPAPVDWMKQLGAHAEAAGMVWGGRWRSPDPNHIERPRASWAGLAYWTEA